MRLRTYRQRYVNLYHYMSISLSIYTHVNRIYTYIDIHIRAQTHTHKQTYTQKYICINAHVKGYVRRIGYVYMYVHTCETLCACQTGHRLYLGISKPHENTQTLSICVSRNW